LKKLLQPPMMTCLRGKQLARDEVLALKRLASSGTPEVETLLLLLGATSGDERYAIAVRLIELHPEVWPGAFGIIPMESGAHGKGLRAWDLAVDKDPTDANVQLNRARYLLFESPSKGEEHMDESLRNHKTASMARAAATFFQELHVSLAPRPLKADAATRAATKAVHAMAEMMLSDGFADERLDAILFEARQLAGAGKMRTAVPILRRANAEEQLVSRATSDVEKLHRLRNVEGLVAASVGRWSTARERLTQAAALMKDEYRPSTALALCLSAEGIEIESYVDECERRAPRWSREIATVLKTGAEDE
jgi:hypothetical protein